MATQVVASFLSRVDFMSEATANGSSHGAVHARLVEEKENDISLLLSACFQE